jgi:hypothetical protein
VRNRLERNAFGEYVMWRTPLVLVEHIVHYQKIRPLALACYAWPMAVALVYLLPIAPSQSSSVTIVTDGWIGGLWQVSLVLGSSLALAGSFMGAKYLPRSLILEFIGAGIIAVELTAYVIAVLILFPWWAALDIAVLNLGYWVRCAQVWRERGRIVRLVAAVQIIQEDNRLHPGAE